MKGIVRILSFAAKELAEVRRQPRLIASLILGPFLILFLFGVGYNSSQPPLHTVLVIPPGTGLSTERSAYEGEFRAPFVLDRVISDREEARRLVQTDQVDAAIVLTENPTQSVLQGRKAQLELLYTEIDPIQGGWIPYFGSVLVSELNRRITEQAVTALQQQTRNLETSQGDVTSQLDQLQSAVQGGDAAAAAEQAARAEATLAAVEQSVSSAVGVLGGAQNALGGPEVDQVQQELREARENLAQVRQAAEAGAAGSPEQQERIASVRSDVDEIMPIVRQLNEVPPEVLAAPLELQDRNMLRYQPTVVAFYGPAVLALLLQHLALTLSSLSIVRERLLGALEIFRVAPVGKTEIFFGKYVGYGLITLGIGAILTALITTLLGVPILGSWLYFVVVLVLLVLSSLSVGFLISTLSRSESQAVQLSMIVLLASIFFSGFFLALESLLPAVQVVSYALPVTYGILSLKEVMLLGETPEWWLLVAPLGIFLLTLFVATRLLKRDLARA